MSNISELKQLMADLSLSNLANYLGLDYSTISLRMRKGKMPTKYARQVIEYIEMHNDDMIEYCQKLANEAKEDFKTREDKIKAIKSAQNKRYYERTKNK